MQARSCRPAQEAGARLSAARLSVAIVLALHGVGAAAQTVGPPATPADAVDLDRVQVKATYRESLQQ